VTSGGESTCGARRGTTSRQSPQNNVWQNDGECLKHSVILIAKVVWFRRVGHRFEQAPADDLKPLLGTGRPPRRLQPADDVPQPVQRLAPPLARHSDINPTMNTYTMLGVLDPDECRRVAAANSKSVVSRKLPSPGSDLMLEGALEAPYQAASRLATGLSARFLN
jgi:hypothetical protein